jgi:hypothetical protein
VVAGALELRVKIQHDRNGTEIGRIIADLKAKKIPTNGGEFVKRIPDEQNAWLVVGPQLIEKHQKGWSVLYKSGIAMDLLYAGKKQDLPILLDYLKTGESTRETISKAMARQPSLQVEHDFDEGTFLLLPEFASFKSVCKDYVLEAFAKALQGDSDGAKRSLATANRFAVVSLKGNFLISMLVGQSIRKMIYISALRIQEEASPEVAAAIADFMLSPEMAIVSDTKRIVTGDLVMSLSTVRALDIPQADKPKIFYPLSLLIKQKNLSASEVEELAKVRHGDYLPKSPTMRRYLKTRLQEWQPLLAALDSYKPDQKLPDLKLFETAFVGTEKAPDIMKDLMFQEETKVVYEALGSDREYVDINRAMWKGIALMQRTGRVPSSIEEMGLSVRQISTSETFTVKPTKKGFGIYGSRLQSNGNDSVVQLAYPVNTLRTASQISRSQDVLNQFRRGDMDRLGRLKSPSTSAAPKVP